MKLTISTHIAALTLFLMIPAYGMEDESQAIVPFTAKIQAGFAAAAPLLVCPPLMVPAVALMSATAPHIPALTTRAAATTALTMPMNGIAAAIADTYIAPHSSSLNTLSKYIASFYLSNQTSDYLTRHHIIPPAPTATSLSEIVCHTAIGYGAGAVTRRAIYSPYDKFMRHLDADYKGKDGAIAEISKSQDLPDAPTARTFTQWNPNANATTKHIKQKFNQKETLLYNIPEKAGITCKLSLINGAILVSEGTWDKNSQSMQCSITKYTTDASQWYYLKPFGASAFGKEIKQLQRIVWENHVTAAGIPLKDIIQLVDESTDL
jgi:hypothetical protein